MVEYNLRDAFKSLEEVDDSIVAKEKRIIKESLEKEETIKDEEVETFVEGYIGQTVEDFFRDCVDPSAIDELHIADNDADDFTLVFEGNFDDLPDGILNADFDDFDCGGDKVVVNVSEEGTGGDFYTTLQDFLEDFNGDEIEVQVDGETVFEGDKYDLPEDMEYYSFESFDAPKYICVNARGIELDELEEALLSEKLPKDLARAYRRSNSYKSGFTGNDRRQSHIDYNASEYKEITPEEALEIKKNGDLSKLRILLKGNLIAYSDTGHAKTETFDVYGDKAYTTKEGNTIYNVNKMPFKHIVKVADKIYLADEKALPYGRWENGEYKLPDNEIIQKRSQQRKDLVPDTGAHPRYKRSSYDTPEYHLKREKGYLELIQEKELALKHLDIDHEAGILSDSEYEDKKVELEKSIATYKEYADNSKKQAILAAAAGKDQRAKDRFALSAEQLGQNLKKYKELQSSIRSAEYDLSRIKERGGKYSFELTGGSYDEKVKKIEEIKAEMERLQKQLDTLQAQATDELKQSNIDENTAALNAAEKKVDDLKAELQAIKDKAHEASKKEGLEEDLINLSDDKEVAEEKEKLEKEKKETPIEQVVDASASIIDDLKGSYVGNAILQCTTCKTLVYKSPEELEKQEGTEGEDAIYNVDEECPHCGAKDGYELIGQVAKLDTQEQKEETETEKESEEDKESEVSEKADEEKEIKVEEALLTDLDEESFDSHITKYLKEVYENVESYKSTEGSINDKEVIIEGLIKFNSGKEKATTFKLSLSEDKLTGLNESLGKEEDSYSIEGHIENKCFITDNINYKYKVGEELVEGCTKVEESFSKADEEEQDIQMIVCDLWSKYSSSSRSKIYDLVKNLKHDFPSLDYNDLRAKADAAIGSSTWLDYLDTGNTEYLKESEELSKTVRFFNNEDERDWIDIKVNGDNWEVVACNPGEVVDKDSTKVKDTEYLVSYEEDEKGPFLKLFSKNKDGSINSLFPFIFEQLKEEKHVCEKCGKEICECDKQLKEDLIVSTDDTDICVDTNNGIVSVETKDGSVSTQDGSVIVNTNDVHINKEGDAVTVKVEEDSSIESSDSDFGPESAVTVEVDPANPEDTSVVSTEASEEENITEAKSENKFEVLWYEGDNEEDAMQHDPITKEFDYETDAKDFYKFIKDDEGKFGFWVTERDPDWKVVKDIII